MGRRSSWQSAVKIKILAVGQKMPVWVKEAVHEYQKRMPRELKIEWHEIVATKRSGQYDQDKAQQQEAERMERLLQPGDHLLALEVLGQSWSTPDLAQQLAKWQLAARDVAIIIGGADGIWPPLSKRAAQHWSLSALTLPHPLVRVLLSEQLYRAWTINAGHPYHKE